MSLVASNIYIGLGANLPADGFKDPRSTLEGALNKLNQHPSISVLEISPWYETAPVPISDQPWYVNGVARIQTTLTPRDLLYFLHEVESLFGRVRRIRNEARVLDMDLLAYEDVVALVGAAGEPVLPHPRLGERAFVVYPLRDLAPGWRHPKTGQTLDDMIAALPSGQNIRRLDSQETF